MDKQHYKNIALLTGIPRSGSTLCCNLLNQQPNTIALHEPISVSALENESEDAAYAYIIQYFNEARQSLLQSGKAKSKQKNGSIPKNPVELGSNSNSLRNENVTLGEVFFDKILDNSFQLIIKQNALFAALLPQLKKMVKCYAVIRNPLSVLASWSTVNLPVNRGRVPAAENFSRSLKRQLDITPDSVDRQLLILSWFFRQYGMYVDQGNIVKYEDVIASQGACLSIISNSEINTPFELVNKNASDLYDTANVEALYHKLVNSDGDYWNYYSVEEVNVVMQNIRDRL